MAESQKEQDAFFALLATFELSRPIVSLSDLCDGTPLFEILQVVDAQYFRQPSRSSAQATDNWVLRFGTLKRLYRLMTQYYTDILRQPTTALEVPDLQAMAKDEDASASLAMCRLTIVIAVQSARNREIINKIQMLSQENQHCLMKAIEQSMSKLKPNNSTPEIGSGTMNDDDHYYQIQSDRSRILAEKETIESVYKNLLEGQRTLQTNYDDAVAEKEDALSRLRDLRREVDDRRSEKADSIMRAEIDRLRIDLQKSEDNLNVAEAELDKHHRLVEDLHHKVEELQVYADEAVRLKDQVDEYRHAADKLQKTENVMEKYKKKLEESADLRRRIKALEEQNASLVDKNASLEEEYRKVSAFKPLLESYKYQIADLEARGSTKNREIDSLKFELEQARTLLKISAEERQKDNEALELYQERVKELELTSVRPVSKNVYPQPNDSHDSASESESAEPELLASPNQDDDDPSHGLGGELDDALTGRTMTDLKLEIRKLKRDLEAARTNQADTSRILVLENLLDDANRMKARYEADYLGAHREKLVMQRDLEEIRSGKSLGDGAEAAIALRQRLNETVDQLDALKKAHAELEVKFEGQSKELTIAKSDLTLVNKDQVEILAVLRDSVNEDKAGLEADMEKLQNHIKELSDKNKMQLEQINGLLLEKITLQSDGIGQREKMLERERNFSDLRASINGKDVPEDVKARILKLHEENVALKEQLSTTQSKLSKARNFIKQQDKLFRAEQTRSNAGSPGTFDDIESVSKSQLKILEDEIERYKKTIEDTQARYDREQRLMLDLMQRLGEQRAVEHLATQSQQQKFGPSSWLGQQRRNLGGSLLRR
ncbi:HOOK-domain-containing protein [Phellopilus nigrolimitatus]|nr:HOOK-domain-containing protein [Phellopilus nigrolimitatus]